MAPFFYHTCACELFSLTTLALSTQHAIVNNCLFGTLKWQFHQALTSQDNQRVVLSAFHSMLVVESSWTSIEIEMKFVHGILKHGRKHA